MKLEQSIPAEWISQSGIVFYLLRGDVESLHATYVTANVLELTGFSSTEAKASGWWMEHLHPDERARLLARQLELSRRELVVDDYRFRHRQGHYLWIRDQRRRLADGGEPGIVGTWTDITALKRTKEELRRTVERLEHAEEAAGLGSWSFDVQTGEGNLSPQMYRLFGLEPARGAPSAAEFLRLVHPDDRAALAEVTSQLAAGAEPPVRPFRTDPERGPMRFLAPRYRRVVDAAGLARRFEGSLLDVTEQVVATTALAASEERYRYLFDANPLPMWVYDEETLAFLAVNAAAVARYGYSRDEFLAMTLREIRPPDELPRLLAHLARGSDPHRSAGEWRHRRKDGEILEVEVHSHSLSFAGRPARMVVINDLTERHRAERIAQETERSYSSLFQSVADAIYVQDSEGRFLDVNDGALRMYGYPRARFLGNTPEFLSAPGRNDLGAVGEAVARALAGEAQQFEFWGLRSNGEVFPKEVRLFPGTFRGETVVIALARDITERKRAHAELRRLQKAIEHAAEVVVLTDSEANIQYVNPAFELVTGYSREEALGANTRILKSGQQSPELYRELWATITSGRTWHGRLVNRRKDGSLYTEESSISPVFDELGRTVNFVAVKRDISAQLRLEDQFAQAQKMESVGRLAGGVAHDFNNMLCIVLGYSELAKGRIEPEHPAQEDLNQILIAAERSGDLVRQLLTFARRQPIEPRVVDLNELLRRTGKMLRGLLTEEIDLVVDLDAELGNVRADPSQIDQILANLIVNARDAIAGTGRITVTTRNVTLGEEERERLAAAECVQLSVTDTGDGMDDATLERIFEPFFTTKAAGKGTGLGLATVYGIVQQNGGQIRVESAPGRGTSFRILLPRAAADAATESGASALAPGAKAETILLVEDNAQLLRLTREQLERLGYRVLSTSSSLEACGMAERLSGGIDLLLTDVVMPDLNGRELAERLRAARPRLPVLYMSGHPAEILTERGIVPEDVFFLQKPFDRALLAQKIRVALAS